MRTLFDPPFVEGSETSELAAAEFDPRDLAKLRRRVFEHVRDLGERGATDCELQAALGMSGNTERPRRVELVEAGLIRDSGRTRKTTSGRAAVVWVAFQRGVDRA